MAATKTAPKKGAKANPADEQPEVPLRDQIRERFQAGIPRGEIAEEFGLRYQQVYAYTKDLGSGEGSGGRAKVMVEWPKGSGNQRPRVEVIRELAQGIGTPDGQPMKIGAIAKELGTSYQIVYQATKNLRESAESDEAEDADTVAEDGEEELDEDELEDDDEDED